MTYEGTPGLVEAKEAHGETTLIVDPARVTEACFHLRDEHGFRFLSDISVADYLGWPGSAEHVAGYTGSAAGRDINQPGTWGLSRLPQRKLKRFAVNYHLLKLEEGAPRVRVQVWVDDGEPLPTVVNVWPTADWHEREAYDLMGIRCDGHPNLRRIIMEDDWEGHPLRKDYPIGGEPVRFSGED